MVKISLYVIYYCIYRNGFSKFSKFRYSVIFYLKIFPDAVEVVDTSPPPPCEVGRWAAEVYMSWKFILPYIHQIAK